MATETLALFEHLEFDFLEEFDVFAPRSPGASTDHHPPALFRAFLHCYYKNVYGIRPVTRELQNTVVWLSCGFDRPPSRPRSIASSPTSNTSSTRSSFSSSRPPAAAWIACPSIPRTPDDARRPRRVERLRSNRRRVLPRLRLYDRLDRAKDRIAAEFTRASKRPKETAMRVTCDALAVDETDLDAWRQRLRHVSAGTTTCWPRGSCQSPVVVPTHENTDDPKDIEYRVEARIDEHSEDVQLKQSTLDETYNRRRWSRTNQRRRQDCGLGHVRASPVGEKVSSRCAFVSLLRSPTTNASIRKHRHRCSNYSMTPSTKAAGHPVGTTRCPLSRSANTRPSVIVEPGEPSMNVVEFCSYAGVHARFVARSYSSVCSYVVAVTPEHAPRHGRLRFVEPTARGGASRPCLARLGPSIVTHAPSKYVSECVARHASVGVVLVHLCTRSVGCSYCLWPGTPRRASTAGARRTRSSTTAVANRVLESTNVTLRPSWIRVRSRRIVAVFCRIGFAGRARPRTRGWVFHATRHVAPPSRSALAVARFAKPTGRTLARRCSSVRLPAVGRGCPW